MRYLLDTNHWSFIQRRNPFVLRRLRQLPPEDRLCMPVIAQAELLAGMEMLPADSRRRRELNVLHAEVLPAPEVILPVDSAVAQQFATTHARLRRAGTPIETNDVWIAAIALRHDLTLVSSDAHFAWVEGLKLENWAIP